MRKEKPWARFDRSWGWTGTFGVDCANQYERVDLQIANEKVSFKYCELSWRRQPCSNQTGGTVKVDIYTIFNDISQRSTLYLAHLTCVIVHLCQTLRCLNLPDTRDAFLDRLRAIFVHAFDENAKKVQKMGRESLTYRLGTL